MNILILPLIPDIEQNQIALFMFKSEYFQLREIDKDEIVGRLIRKKDNRQKTENQAEEISLLINHNILK